jgi:polyhydroxybutyrate depolymerase
VRRLKLGAHAPCSYTRGVRRSPTAALLQNPGPSRAQCAAALVLTLSACQGGSSAPSSQSSGAADTEAPAATAPGVSNSSSRPERAAHAAPRGAQFALLLHGLGDRGSSFARALDAPDISTRYGLVVAAPDGAPSSRGTRHWNAGIACCDFEGLGTDHVAALRGAMGGRPTIVVGFSNGSFMAQRLACAAPEVVGVVSLAGGDPLDETACVSSSPVAIVHVHGSNDRVVPYEGGHVLGDRRRAAIPSAEATMLRWGERNGCEVARGFSVERSLDLSASLPGAETQVLALRGCRATVELWRIEGGAHLDPVSPGVVSAALAALR